MRRDLLLRSDRRDAGFSLVELLVAMIIFAVLMALATAMFGIMAYQAKDAIARTDSVDQARLGLSQIDRQIRSGNLIRPPESDGASVSGVGPGYSLRIFTQEGGVQKCVQWRVIDADADGYADLEFRSWNPAYPTINEVTSWGVVARNVVTPTSSTIDPSDAATWPPFWLDPTVVSGANTQNVRITLRLKDPDSRADSKPIAVSSVVTGRNTVFGYAEDTCSIAPAP